MSRKLHSSTKRLIDAIGKPNKVSNIRPLKCLSSPEQGGTEKKLNELKLQTQLWHHDFWYQHNLKFNEEKDDFISNYFKRRGVPPVEGNGARKVVDPEDMAIFHRDFLKKNHKMNLAYDREWRQRNREIITLMLKVETERTLRRIRHMFGYRE